MPRLKENSFCSWEQKVAEAGALWETLWGFQHPCPGPWSCRAPAQHQKGLDSLSELFFHKGRLVCWVLPCLPGQTMGSCFLSFVYVHSWNKAVVLGVQVTTQREMQRVARAEG